MKILILALVLASATAMAEIKLLSQQKATAVYLDEAGKQLTPGAAIISLAKGGRVLKCTEVEANETKSGIGLRSKR